MQKVTGATRKGRLSASGTFMPDMVNGVLLSSRWSSLLGEKPASQGRSYCEKQGMSIIQAIDWLHPKKCRSLGFRSPTIKGSIKRPHSESQEVVSTFSSPIHPAAFRSPADNNFNGILSDTAASPPLCCPAIALSDTNHARVPLLFDANPSGESTHAKALVVPAVK